MAKRIPIRFIERVDVLEDGSLMLTFEDVTAEGKLLHIALRDQDLEKLKLAIATAAEKQVTFSLS